MLCKSNFTEKLGACTDTFVQKKPMYATQQYGIEDVAKKKIIMN